VGRMVWVWIMRLWKEGLRGVANLLSILGGISLDTGIDMRETWFSGLRRGFGGLDRDGLDRDLEQIVLLLYNPGIDSVPREANWR